MKVAEEVQARTFQWNHVGASALAGSIARLLTHPIDTIRVQQQVYEGKTLNLGQFTRQMLHRHGWRGLYRGLAVTIAMGVPGVSVYLSFYEATKQQITQAAPQTGPSITFLTAGLVAEAASGMFWTPMEVVKQRLQVSGSLQNVDLQHGNACKAFLYILRSEGPLGLYRGYFSSLLVFGPYSSIYFFLYENAKNRARYLKEASSSSKSSEAGILSHDSEGLPFSYILCCSAVSAGVASFAVNPLDVIKTRWQVHSRTSPSSAATTASSNSKMVRKSFANPLDVLKDLLQNEGYIALFKGAKARALFSVPNVAITMALYEFLKDKLLWTTSLA